MCLIRNWFKNTMSKSNLEWNKIFAAVLVAGIVASMTGFVAREIFHHEDLEEDAYPIEGIAAPVAGAPAGPTGPQPILALISADQVAQGQKLSKACAACHSFDQGGPNRVGPNLWGVIGRDIASHEGFSYSEDMQAQEGAWDYEKLNHFMYKPKDWVKGTKMNFIGLKKPEERAAVISWLRTLSASEPAMPTPDQIAAERAELDPAPEAGAEEAKAPDEGGNVAAPDETAPAPVDTAAPAEEESKSAE